MVNLHGGAISSAEATVLSGQDIHAHNTFEQQNIVAPKNLEVKKDGASLRLVFPQASVLKLKIDLA